MTIDIGGPPTKIYSSPCSSAVAASEAVAQVCSPLSQSVGPGGAPGTGGDPFMFLGVHLTLEHKIHLLIQPSIDTLQKKYW